MKRKKKDKVLYFLSMLKELEIIEAIGVARLLKVDLLTIDCNLEVEKIKEKEYDVLLSEMIDAFVQLGEKEQKFILTVMKNATGR